MGPTSTSSPAVISGSSTRRRGRAGSSAASPRSTAPISTSSSASFRGGRRPGVPLPVRSPARPLRVLGDRRHARRHPRPGPPARLFLRQRPALRRRRRAPGLRGGGRGGPGAALVGRSGDAAAGPPHRLPRGVPGGSRRRSDAGRGLPRLGLAAAGGRAVFTACDDTAAGLWGSDGTPAGTVLLPGTEGPCEAFPDFDIFRSAGGLAYFDFDGQLWRTDGTPGERRRSSAGRPLSRRRSATFSSS